MLDALVTLRLFKCLSKAFNDASDSSSFMQDKQALIQGKPGPSFTRLGGSDKVKVSLMYIGVLTGVTCALIGQNHLFNGTGKV